MAIVPEQIENRVTMGFSSTASGFMSRRIESWTWIDLHANVHGSLIHNSQEMEDTQVFIDRWMDKVDAFCTYSGMLFTLKKKEILAYAPT